ncbi:MAG: hypothetical protein ABI433_01085 [Burkholderiaceae bacterium]
MNIPGILVAGDSLTWVDYAFGDALGASVDAGAYSLAYSFRGPVAAAGLDVVGTPRGTGWSFTLTTAQSAAMNVGATPQTWYWQASATKAGARVTAGDGSLYVKPNLAGLTAGSSLFDGTSPAEKILAAIEAEITARATGGMTLEYTIGNRSLKKEPIGALLALRTSYKLIVSRERRGQQIANGLGNPGRVGVRFTS